MADLGGTPDARPYEQKISQFHAVFPIFFFQNHMLAPLERWRSHLRRILDPPRKTRTTEQRLRIKSRGNCTRRFLFLLDDDCDDDDSNDDDTSVKRSKAAFGRKRRYHEQRRQQQRKSQVRQKDLLGGLNRKSTYTCRKCGLNWKDGSEFGYHMKEVHRRPVYLCTYENCDKVFIRRDSQKYHLMEHEGKYTFNCEILRQRILPQISLPGPRQRPHQHQTVLL